MRSDDPWIASMQAHVEDAVERIEALEARVFVVEQQQVTLLALIEELLP